jgi:hypothetical protein
VISATGSTDRPSSGLIEFDMISTLRFYHKAGQLCPRLHAHRTGLLNLCNCLNVLCHVHRVHPVTREQIWRDQNAAHPDISIDLASVAQLEKPDAGDQCQPSSRGSLLE